MSRSMHFQTIFFVSLIKDEDHAAMAEADQPIALTESVVLFSQSCLRQNLNGIKAVIIVASSPRGDSFAFGCFGKKEKFRHIQLKGPVKFLQFVQILPCGVSLPLASIHIKFKDHTKIHVAAFIRMDFLGEGQDGALRGHHNVVVNGDVLFPDDLIIPAVKSPSA